LLTAPSQIGTDGENEYDADADADSEIEGVID
jgi:hypothetical protein